eukprot:jgi/Botrbrau1/11635/Bobra.0209s0025.1
MMATCRLPELSVSVPTMSLHQYVWASKLFPLKCFMCSFEYCFAAGTDSKRQSDHPLELYLRCLQVRPVSSAQGVSLLIQLASPQAGLLKSITATSSWRELPCKNAIHYVSINHHQ